MAETRVSPTEMAPEPPAPEQEERELRTFRSILRSAEIDARLAGMLVALVVIWVAFQILTPNHNFLTPRNLWNLSVQTSVVAIMATGMVLIIVTRNIDLSVGSSMAAAGMAMAVVQHDWLPKWLGFDHPLTWIIAVVVGLVLGSGDRRVPGIHRRLRRRPVVHRDAGRVPRVARPRLVDGERADDRADGHRLPPARRRVHGNDRRHVELGRRGGRVCRPRRPADDEAAPARPVRLPPPPAVGGGDDRGGRERGDPRPDRVH